MSSISSLPHHDGGVNVGDSNGEIVAARRNGSTDSSGYATGDATGEGNYGQFYYVYPYDFFVLTTGCVPKGEADLVRRWAYRKKRQNNGSSLMDVQPFDKDALVGEMAAIRQSLRDYAQHAYLDHIRPLLKDHDLVRPEDGQACVNMKDVCKMINTAPAISLSKSDMLFEIFYYKRADWATTVVDDWASTNNYTIRLPEKVVGKQRQPNTEYYRGSFGPIVNAARTQSVKKIMRNMWSGQGWKITLAIKDGSEQRGDYETQYWSKDPTQKYYNVQNASPGDDDDDGEKVCCVLTCLNFFDAWTLIIFGHYLTQPSRPLQRSRISRVLHGI
jgi:hypothetical protein